jgi:hypothetical protein
MPQHEARARSSAAVTATALALLLGGITAAVGDAVAGSTPAALPGAAAVHGTESEDGRLRTRMIVAHRAGGTHLIFEVHLRDRTWMAPDERLLRVVVRAVPVHGVHGPSGPDRFRSAVVAAATLPGAATGFTFFRAALDVTGLDRGDYIASVELVARGERWGERGGGRGNVIDRVTQAYEAW